MYVCSILFANNRGLYLCEVWKNIFFFSFLATRSLLQHVFWYNNCWIVNGHLPYLLTLVLFKYLLGETSAKISTLIFTVICHIQLPTSLLRAENNIKQIKVHTIMEFWIIYLRQITLRIVGYHFSSRLTATLNLCSIYLVMNEDGH